MSDSLNEIPDISFTNDLSYEDVRANLINYYLEEYKRATGEDAVLQAGSRERLELDACAIMFYQILQVVEFNGRMNNLKTSEGDYLDNLATLFHQVRTPATPARTVLRFTLSAPQEFIVSIPAGTEVAAGEVVFSTDEYVEINPGEEYINVSASCTVAGAHANELVPGEVNIMMKDIAYVESVINIETTHDGQDVLSDEDFRTLIFLSNGAEYSGTIDGYEYRARKINPDIEDIQITSDSLGVVNIIFIKSGGLIPSDEECAYLQEELSKEEWKESTDQISVAAPEVVEYDIDVTYYVYSGADVESVNQHLLNAIEEFQKWQAGKIGRDINDSKLIYMLQNFNSELASYVKRIVCAAPGYKRVESNQIGKAVNITLTYGGIEDD